MAKVMFGAMRITCRFIHVGQMCFKNIAIRKPVRVLNVPTEEREVVMSVVKKGVALPELPKVEPLPAIIEKPEENVVPYTKLSKHDGRFIKTIGIIKNRQQREKSGKILLEGKRLINDAILAGMQLKTLYFSRESDLKDIKLKNPEEVEVCKVLYKTLRVWSDLKTCPGIMGIFKRPSADDLHVLSQSTLPVTILCDNIRDPGNLGSIIRNAAAAGCTNVLLLKGCIDPWETKVLRAGSGGHFRIPIVNNIEWSQVSNYIPSTSTIFVADNSVEVDEVFSSTDFISFDDVEEKEKTEEEEETKYVTFNEHEQPIKIDETFDSKPELEKYEIPLPCHFYCGIKYPKDNIVLYIGGETHGVDSKIVKLVCEYGGKKVKIPMENETDSMNSAFAMTVILYEIKRQLTQKYVVK